MLWALALTLTAAPLQAQQDSVLVDVIDRTDLNLIISPEGPIKAFRGDSIQFTAIAVDTVSGDTINASLIWSSTNPNVIEVDPETGWARFRNRGNAAVVVEVADIISMIFMAPDDQQFWREVYSPERDSVYARLGSVPDQLRLRVGDQRPLCVYEQDELDQVRLSVPLAGLRSADEGIVSVVHDPMQSNCPAWGQFPLSPDVGAMTRLAFAQLRGGR
jgi:hypothetical protein